MRTPQIGELFANRYQIESRLGQGAFGEVFRARDAQLQRDVALKVLMPVDDAYPPRAAARFEREARVVATLQHPNTVRLYEYGQAPDGLMFMAFELVDGSPLNQLARQTQLDERTVRHILGQLLGALTEAHEGGALHRDIKPANIIVHEYGADPFCVKLLDFGIAKLAEPEDGQPGLTKTGAIIGTPRFMTPEQMVGDTYSAQSDLFAVGLVAYELLFGSEAMDQFRADSAMRYLSQATDRAPLPPIGEPTLARVLDSILHHAVDHRAPSARAALNMLTATSQSQRAVVAQTRSGPVEPAPATSPRSRYAPLFIAIFVGGVLGLVGWFAIIGDPDAPRVVRADPATILTPATSSPPRSDDRKGTADAGPTILEGCAPPAQGHGVLQLDVNGSPEEFAVYVSEGYGRSRDAPLIIILPANSLTTPADYILDSGFEAIAEEENGVVMTIAQLGPTKRLIIQDYRMPSFTKPDMKYIGDVLRTATESLCVSPKRVYVVAHMWGMQQGARMGCEDVPEIAGLAAIAPNSSSEELFPCDAPPVPFITFYPHRSDYVPYMGGTGCKGFSEEWYAASRWTTEFKKRNQCRDKGEVRSVARDTKCQDWNGCAAPMTTCEVMAGSWFPGQPKSGVDLLKCHGPRARTRYAELIWDFFEPAGDAKSADYDRADAGD